MNEALVSVCMPAYNCGKYILQTLNCLTAQTYRKLEIIIVNDGSTDNTPELIQSFEDARIRLIHSKNGGAAKARNTAYLHSAGKYIIFFDADDLVKPDFISLQLNKMNGREDVVMMSGWGRFYRDDPGTFSAQVIAGDERDFETWITHYWNKGNAMTTPGRAMISRRLIQLAGLWNEKLTLNDDMEFFTRIFLNATKIEYNPEAMFYYRSGIKGLSSKKDPEAFASLFNAVMLSVNQALQRFPGNRAVERSCANLWQSVLYEIYPQEKEMSKIAEQQIDQLGGADISFPSGGYTRLLASLTGWKAAKKLKTIFHKY